MKRVNNIQLLLNQLWTLRIESAQRGPLVFAANLWNGTAIIAHYSSDREDLNNHKGFAKEELEVLLDALISGERQSLVIRYGSDNELHIVKFTIIKSD